MIDKLLRTDMSKSIYANVGARFDYRFDVRTGSGLNFATTVLELYLYDMTFLI